MTAANQPGAPIEYVPRTRQAKSLRLTTPGPRLDGSRVVGLTSTYSVGEQGVESITLDGVLAFVRGGGQVVTVSGGWLAQSDEQVEAKALALADALPALGQAPAKAKRR